MSGTEWLDGYEGQTTDELIALEDKYRIDSLVLAFEQALDVKATRLGLEGLTAEERVILAIEAIEREVNNGGYDQLFVNSSKVLAPYFVSSLIAINCPVVGQVTQQAIDALAIDGPLSVAAIDLAMEDDNERRDGQFGECTDRYFSVAGDLAGPLFAYVKGNRARISLGS